MATQATLSQSESHFDFSFVNAGTTPVILKKLETSCGCTVASTDNTIYVPGSKGHVLVTVQLGAATGTVDKTVVVETTDLSEPTIKLTAEIQIPDILRFEPNPNLNWKVGGEGAPAKMMVAVTAPFGIRILGLKDATTLFHATIEEVLPSKEYRLVVKPTSTQTSVNTSLRLLMKADWPGPEKILWLPVHIE